MAIEYALIAALIAGAILMALTNLGASFATVLTRFAVAMTGA